MCRTCLDKGRVVYGPETFGGEREDLCPDCRCRDSVLMPVRGMEIGYREELEREVAKVEPYRGRG